jgi:acetate---CoA ligase (ADP-forming)
VPRSDLELDAFLRPRSVAIVGASAREGTLSARLLRNLVRYDYPGAVHAVNPKYEEVHGLPCHPSLDAIPSSPDLVLSLVPATEVLPTLQQAADAGARAAIVFSSGFAELGPEGVLAERKLAALADAAGMAILGPNSQGLFHAPTGLAATFNPGIERELPDGPGIAFVGQSGAIGASFIDIAREAGVGVSTLISTGNQAQLGLVTFARHLVHDPAVRVLTLYVESVPDHASYVALLRAARARGTPVVVLRAGRSTAGRRAVASHTGAILQQGEAFDLVTRQEGAVLVRDLDELVYAAGHGLERPTGPIERVAVVTTSGGGGSLVADACEAAGFVVPVLPADVRDRLEGLVPPFGSVTNPVDVTGQAVTPGGASCGDICQLVLASPVDAVVFVLGMATGESASHIARDLVRKVRDRPKPLLVIWLAGRDQTAEGRQVFREARIPVLDSFDAVTRMLRVIRDGAAAHDVRELDPPVTDPHLQGDLTALLTGAGPTITEAAGGAFLDRLGIDRPRSVLARSVTEASAVAAELGEDLVAKVQHPAITHKTDVGGVRFGVRPDTAADTYEELVALLPPSWLDECSSAGVLFQRTAPRGGVELLVGLTASTQGFPHLITVGIGGTGADLDPDVASRPAPVSSTTAREMLLSLRQAPLLTGFRGREPLDLDAGAQAIAALSSTASVVGELVGEVEINPLRVYPVSSGLGAVALDLVLTMPPPEGDHDRAIVDGRLEA